MARYHFSFILCLLVLLQPEGSHARDPETGTPRDVVFVAEVDGTDQRYVELIPRAYVAGEPVDVLIALHGHGSDRWQFIRNPRDECRAVRDVSAEAGMILISPDYRAKTSWMGPAAEQDLLQIIRDLRSRFTVRRVILCGGSMGGSASLTFAALHPDMIDGVAALNGTANHLEYTNFQDAISQSFGGLKSRIPEEYKKRSAEYWPERFTMPTAMTTGGKDTAVPPDSVIRLHAILQLLGRKSLLIHRPDGGHATNYEDSVAALRYAISGE
ncbi:MAG: alpha/beta fold hydrolase [Planctomycetaceae bacterium]|nr:alpha/beta fold hydrolase [Planctomycetaceae bacterium]